MSADVVAAAPNPTAQPLPAAVEARTHAWKAGKDGSFGFRDLLDAINPLQHIPLVSAIYRRLTGDAPGNVAQLAGDMLFGGPIGLGGGLFSLAFKEETGREPGEMALALLTGDSSALAETAVAATDASDAPPALAAAADDGAPRAAPALPVTAVPLPSLPPAPVLPAHPPIPLNRAPSATSAPGTALGDGARAAESGFLARDALMRRGLMARQAAPAPARTFAAPIPLQLTGQASQVVPLHPPPRTSSAAAMPAATPASPGDIAQRMQDALDKYRRLEAQRAGAVDLHQ